MNHVVQHWQVYCRHCGDPIRRLLADGPYVNREGCPDCWGPYGDTWRRPGVHQPKNNGGGKPASWL